MVVYFRFVVGNRPTLAGYISVIVSTLLFCLARHEHLLSSQLRQLLSIVFVWGMFALLFTAFGKYTYDRYIKTLSILKHYGNTDRLKNVFATDYCSGIGIKLAIKDARRRGWIKQ